MAACAALLLPPAAVAVAAAAPEFAPAVVPQRAGDGGALQESAARALRDALAARGLRARVQLLPQTPQSTASSGPVSTPRIGPGWRVVALRVAERDRPTSRMCVWAELADARGARRSVPLWFNVVAEQRIWTARTSLAAGTVLSEATLAATWVDVAGLPVRALAADSAVAGLRLRHAVGAGSVIAASAVEPRPAVQRDETVQVEVTLGAVRLQTSGIALADARVGQRVWIVNPASRERFRAEVVANGAVRADGS